MFTGEISDLSSCERRGEREGWPGGMQWESFTPYTVVENFRAHLSTPQLYLSISAFNALWNFSLGAV
jgi:hypothetical protein